MHEQLQACSAAADGNRSHRLRNEPIRAATTCRLGRDTLLEEAAAFKQGVRPDDFYCL